MVTQILWDMLKRQPPVLYGDGRQTRDFIWIGDVVNATLQAMELLPADVYNVGTGKSYSFNEVVSLINKALGTSIKPRYIENPLANYVKDTRASIQKIQSALKRPLAMTPFEEGLKHIIAYYKRPHV
jgi:UDP-glucose 4-epimerase